MIREEDITPDELSEWRAHPVTQMVLGLVQDERRIVASSFERGELLDENNPVITHGRVARAWGQLESLDSMIKYITEKGEQHG
jgi:hypothetical protein